VETPRRKRVWVALAALILALIGWSAGTSAIVIHVSSPRVSPIRCVTGAAGAGPIHVSSPRVGPPCTGTGGAAGAGGAAGSGTGGSGTGGSGTGGAATGGSGTGGTGTGGTGTGGSATGGTGGVVGCGDGVIQPGELCDGSALDNATCALLGYSGGSLACSSTCQFNVSSCTGGTITPTITASRTSCTAPCAVNFDVTSTSGLSGSNYWRANWAWDFNDTASTHKGTIGHVVGHVFDNPGTYVVVARVHDLAGAAGSATKTITVSAMSGTTYYVSSSGSDGNPGTSMGSAWATFAHAITSGYATNNTVLLRRGDTFVSTGVDDDNYTTAGPFLIGAYTDPGHVSALDPIITDSLGSGHGLFNFYANGLTIQHVHLKATNHLSQFISFNSTTNDLVEYCEIEGIGATGDTGDISFQVTGGAASFAVDNYLHDFHAYGIYFGGASGATALGNTLLNFDGGATSLHGMRFSATTDGTGTANSNYYIAENTLDAGPSSNSFTSFTIHGDVQHVVVVGNTVDHDYGIGPTNAASNEKPNAVLWEDNASQKVATAVSYQGLAADASNMEIRNNVLLNADVAIVVGNNYPLMPANWPDQVFVENNTAFQKVPSGVTNSGDIFFGSHVITTGFALFENNVFQTNATSTTSKMVQVDGAGTETIDYNDIYTPNATLASPGVGTHGVVGNPLFVSPPADSTLSYTPAGFEIQSGSAAQDVGTNTHVYEDFYRVVRPQNGSWDMGAHERKNP